MAFDIFGKLRDLGFKTCPESFYSNVDVWKSWYDGDVRDFHHYTVYNGQRRLNCDRYGLGMGKQVCEDWANLLMNEKVKVTLEGEPEQAFFDDVCKKNSFLVKASELEEMTFGFGTTAIVARAVDVPVNEATGAVVGPGRLRLDYCFMPYIFPLSWENGRIIECAFATSKVNGNDEYMYLQVHKLNEQKTYDILNFLFRDNNGSMSQVPLDTIDEYRNVAETIHTGETERMFVINRPNIVNNIDPTLPLGISCFANAIPQLKGTDISYDAYVNELVLGKKRVMVKAEALKDIKGEYVFDPTDVTYYTLPEDSSSGAEATMIHELDMSLRTAQLNGAVQDMLNLLSSKVGFGQNMYKFNQGSIATATQIISENSTLFRTVKKHEIILREMLTELAQIILRMGNLYCGQKLNPEVEITIDFDDSIIEDKATERINDREDVAMGVMNLYEYRMKWYNESEETAKAALPKTNDLMRGLVEDETETNPPPQGGTKKPVQAKQTPQEEAEAE